MKTYETAREILDCLVDFHHRAARLVEAALDLEQDDRVAMVLDYLYEHHSKLQDSLANYEEDAEPGVLNTQVPYSLNSADAPEAFVASLDVGEHMTLEQVVKLGRDLGDYVVSLVDDVSGEISAPRVSEVFANLLEMEATEQRMLTRAVNSLRDI